MGFFNNTGTGIETEKLLIENSMKECFGSCNATRYIINEDFTVDVCGDLDVEPWVEELPVKIRNVWGDMDFSRCGLKSCKNFPDYVRGDVYLREVMNIKDLEGFPALVAGDVSLRDSGIESLKGMGMVTGIIDLNDCEKLESLEYLCEGCIRILISDNCKYYDPEVISKLNISMRVNDCAGRKSYDVDRWEDWNKLY